MRIVLLLLAGVVACNSDADVRCERGVRHVFALTVVGPKPGAEEQAVIDQIVDQTLAECRREGLSQAQLDCILAARALTDRSFLTCPALVARKPSWIIAPIGQPELLDKPAP